MNKERRSVEVFTAGCPVCDPVVNLVKEVACDACEITVFDLIKQCDDQICLDKVTQYQIIRVPAVAVNGKLLEICRDEAITKGHLMKAGIGQPIT